MEETGKTEKIEGTGMTEETEEFMSGFCKKQNQTRTVLCEFGSGEDGKRNLLSSDCDYGCCEHSKDCRLMAAALK
ncbi:MAG: ubiquinone biosynthesis protein UbiE [Clostridiales bacterium]|nr:ubiquinone biosynthesis protein UbiE [Clostridiales bacterium]